MESVIKWQTSTPTENGKYLVFANVEIDIAYWDNRFQWMKYLSVTDWCKLSDIEPYKE
jgi:hypothetical protein